MLLLVIRMAIASHWISFVMAEYASTSVRTITQATTTIGTSGHRTATLSPATTGMDCTSTMMEAGGITAMAPIQRE